MTATFTKRKSMVETIRAWLHPDQLERMLANGANLGKRPPFWIPLVLLILGTILLTATDIDLAVSGAFYDAHTDQWPFLYAQPWDWLYHWGVLPGIAIGVAGLVVFLLSFSVKSWREHRNAGLFLALALILGPGLLINGVMKPGWARPRPCQVIRFGGEAKHLPPFVVGNDRSSSFPSGHASIGFALMAPAFLAYRRHRHLAALLFTLGIAGGMVMGLTRIVQGRHFLSDVMWSAAAVYFTCWCLGAIMRLYTLPKVESDDEQESLQVIRLEDQPTRQATDEQRRAA